MNATKPAPRVPCLHTPGLRLEGYDLVCSLREHPEGPHMCFVPPGDPEARKAIFWSDGGRLYPPLDYSDGKRYTERHVLEIGTNSPETSYHQAPTPQDLGFTGEMCQQCGSANVLRTGTCGTCADCGTSTSCG